MAEPGWGRLFLVARSVVTGDGDEEGDEGREAGEGEEGFESRFRDRGRWLLGAEQGGGGVDGEDG